VIEVDARIEQTFAEVLARSRHRAADITDRLAAKQRELEEQSERIKEEGKQLTQEMDRRVAEKLESARNNPWQRGDSKPTVLAFGDEEDRPPAPAQPVTPQPAAPSPPTQQAEPDPEPAPEPAKRFLSFEVDDEEAERARSIPAQPPRSAGPAAEDEDDDYSGRSWVR